MNGSCLCEGVKFQVQGDPENVISCFCSHCSKNAGGPSQYLAKYPREGVKLLAGKDLIRNWILEDNSSGYAKYKVFCGRCGCTLWTIPMRHNGSHLMVRTSLLENGLNVLPPKAEFFVSKRPSYLEGLKGAKSYMTMPGKPEIETKESLAQE